MMKRTRILTFLAGLTLLIVLSSAACSKDDKGINIPGPAASGSSTTGNGSGSGNNNGGNSGNNGSTTTDPVFTESLCTDLGQSPMVLAYYTENSYVDKKAILPDVTLLTHINYAHGRFKNPTTGDGGIEIADIDLMKQVIALKSQNPKLKVMLMVGGWGMKADGFSKMAADATKRTTFCKSLKKHMDTYGLDGVDIDWEYPGVSAEGTGYDKLNDKKNFNLVLKELRETIGNTKIISFASSASHPEYVDWSVAAKYIDYVNVMTYDMGCAPTAHNSPLYSTSTVFNKQTGADKCIQKHVDAGIPKNRLVLGVPFYGKGYNGKKADQYPVADYQVYPYEVNYNQMADIFEKNTVTGRKYNQSNKETIDVTGKNIRKWDDVAKVPYLTDTEGRILLVYDDPQSVEEKGKFAVREGLLGATLWEYKLDGTKLWKKSLRSVTSTISEIAGLDYDAEKDWLWVIDSNSNSDRPEYLGYTVYLFNGDATKLLTSYYVGGFANWNPEAICVDRKNGCIWIADDCGDATPSILHKVKFTNL